MLKRFHKFKLLLPLLLIICILIFLYSCREKNEVHTDIGFVQDKFPNIKDIEAVRYYYKVKSNQREIGLQDVEFCGFIKVGENFCEKISQDYQWKETKKSKKLVPKTVLMEGDNTKYHFLYNYDFSYDGTYKTSSLGGNFYFDKAHRVLYLECDG